MTTPMAASIQITASQEFEQRDMDRAWHLYQAFQFGQEAAGEADASAILSEFLLIFGGDGEALVQFNAGTAFARRLSSHTAVATPSSGI